MTLRGTHGGVFVEDLWSVLRSLEIRTKGGSSHFHRDYGDGIGFGRNANRAKTAGPVRFLHRTLFATPTTNARLPSSSATVSAVGFVWQLQPP